ncbi:hypothetical protein CP556_08710 [Natrinema sp. CBA1119]|nr:hypothetical protein CP556_08710 [Natrinema sp. CBA1119]
MSFDTEAQLSIAIPSSELRNARQQIESEIGTTEIGVTDGGSASAQAAGGGRGGGGRQRRRARREYRWARERTDYLEEAVVYLKDIEDKVGGGDGGGMLSELLGGGAIGGLLGGAGGAAGGIGSGVATGIGAAVGSAVGSAVGDAVTGDKLEVKEPDWIPLDIDEPEEPYDVDHPEDPYELDHPEDPYALDHPEEPYALDHPGDPYDVDHPDEPYALDHPEDAYDVDHPDEPYAISDELLPLKVEEVDPVGVEIEVEVETIAQTGGGGSSGEPEDIPEVDEVEGVGETVKNTADAGGDAVPVVGHVAGGLYGLGAGIGKNAPGSAPRRRENRQRRKRRKALLEQAAENNGGGGTTETSVETTATVTTGGGSGESEPAEINANFGDINVDVRDLDRFVDEVLASAEQKVEDARDDLNDRMDKIERDIQG